MTFVQRIAGAVVLGTALLTGLTLGASPARAVSITYTETATATGSLNGVAFTNASIVLTMHNDTTNVTNPAPGVFQNIGTVTLSINGGIPVTFTNLTDIESTHDMNLSIVSFNDLSLHQFMLGTSNGVLATYDLTTAIGPISSTLGIINPITSFPTTGGAFIINNTSSITFTATIGTQAVPEPSSLALLGTALAGLLLAGAMRHNRQ